MSEEIITPNLIIAGVTKAGTTSLFTYLSDHPDVCASTVKEISHFVTVRFNEPARPIENYSQYFRQCKNEKYRMESSPAYFLGGRELAETVKSALPGVKVIIILREPVSRCISHFKFTKSMLRLPKDMSLQEYFIECQALPLEAFRERKNHIYYGLASGIYTHYIDDWIETFGENLRICFFDELTKSPRQFTQNVCQWLVIDPSYYTHYSFVVENKGRSFNSRGLQRFALKLNKTFEVFLRKNIGLKRVLRKVYFAVNGSRSGQELGQDYAETLEEIRDYYRPYNRVLRAQLLSAQVEGLPEWLNEEA